MFPGIDGFHWTLGHVLFLSLFFAVALTILITVASASRSPSPLAGGSAAFPQLGQKPASAGSG